MRLENHDENRACFCSKRQANFVTSLAFQIRNIHNNHDFSPFVPPVSNLVLFCSKFGRATYFASYFVCPKEAVAQGEGQGRCKGSPPGCTNGGITKFQSFQRSFLQLEVPDTGKRKTRLSAGRAQWGSKGARCKHWVQMNKMYRSSTYLS